MLPPDEGLVAVRDGDRTIIGVRPDAVLRSSGPEALAALDEIEGWWAGFLSYDLGRAVERVDPRAEDDLRLPDVLLGRFDARLVLDTAREPVIEGDGPSRPLLERAIAGPGTAQMASPGLRGWTSGLDRNQWEAAAGRILEHIRAGDCYQVNLTRRLACDRAADPLALFGALALANPAPHAGLVALEGIAVVSASPELFLRRDGREVVTRPIKGTGLDPVALAASEKDRAENVMIVDLARNDIGRVCRTGSVRAPGICEIEAHPGLYHLVSTVTGTLRDGIGPGALVRATFPPASITGAPKPRVMQLIEDLEPVRRGVYCGSVGWITQDTMELNVAIRTFTIARGRTFLGVGGGIVADSDPAAEWRETDLKAARLLQAAAGPPR